MKALLVLATATAALALAVPGESIAQRAMRGGYGGRYDPQTVETVAGEVTAIEKVTYGRRGNYGIHIVLKTDKGEIPIHLGPSWFIDRQTVKIALHDQVEVTGSRVIYDGKPALIAAEVKRGSEILRLRTAEGIPLWSRRGAR